MYGTMVHAERLICMYVYHLLTSMTSRTHQLKVELSRLHGPSYHHDGFAHSPEHFTNNSALDGHEKEYVVPK